MATAEVVTKYYGIFYVCSKKLAGQGECLAAYVFYAEHEWSRIQRFGMGPIQLEKCLDTNAGNLMHKETGTTLYGFAHSNPLG